MNRTLGLVLAVVAVVCAVLWSGSSRGSRRAPPTANEERVRRLDEPELAPGSPARAGTERTTAEPAPPAARGAGTRVLARVVDEAGHPLGDARVRVRADDGESTGSALPDGSVSIDLELEDANSRPHASVWADVEAHAPRHATVRTGARVRIGATTHLGRLVLPQGAAVEGIVVDELGRPFPDADVFVQTTPDGVPPFRPPKDVERQVTSQLPFVAPPEVPRTKTDASGAFRISGLRSGRVRVWASSPLTLGAFSEPLELEPTRTVTCGTLALVPPDLETSVEGVVLDPAGQPVSGARVVMSTIRLMDWPGARTDSSGRFRYMVPGTRAVDLVADDPLGRWCSTTLHGVVAGTSTLRLQLATCRELELCVTDPSGVPVPLFSVTVGSANEPRVMRKHPLGEHADGVLAMPEPPAAFSLHVEAPAFEPRLLGAFEPGGAPSRIECRLTPKPAFRGRVLADGRPVPGARVELWSLTASGEWVALGAPSARPHPFGARVMPTPLVTATDRDGRFVLERVEAADTLLRVEAEGLAPWLDWDFAQPTDEVVVHLGPGGALEGRVLVPDGDDPSGIVVAATCGDGYVVSGRTDADGRCSIPLLAAGSYQVGILAEEPRDARGRPSASVVTGGPAAPTAEVREGETTRVDLDLRAALRPRLVGSLAIDDWSFSDWLVHLVPADVPGERIEPVFLSGTGTFECVLPRRGQYGLRIRGRDARGHAWNVSDTVRVAAPEQPWSLRLYTGELRGDVRIDVGSLWPDLELACLFRGPGSLRVSTGLGFDVATGRLHPAAVPEGRLQVVRLRTHGAVDLDAPMQPLAELDVVAGRSHDVTIP